MFRATNTDGQSYKYLWLENGHDCIFNNMSGALCFELYPISYIYSKVDSVFYTCPIACLNDMVSSTFSSSQYAVKDT